MLDDLVGRSESESLELLGEVVGYQPVTDMPSQLIDRGVVERFDGCFLDGSHHTFGLAVGPRMIGLGQPVLDAILLADTPEDVWERQACAAFELGELDAVIGKHGVDFVRHRFDQGFQKAGSDQFGGSAIYASEDQLGCAVDSDIQVRFAFLMAQFGNVDVEVADLVGFELLRLLAVGLGQLTDPMALQAAVQG